MDQRPLRPVERRIWRLAFLLSGDPAAAAEMIDEVLRSQPDPASMEPARLDRLIVLRAREASASASRPPRAALPGFSDDAAAVLDALTRLPEQPREAWVLTRLDELDAMHVSRAMDCSRTAAAHHLAAADEAMRAALGARLDPCVAAARSAADALDLGPIIAGHRDRLRRRRRLRAALLAGVVGIVVLAALVTVLSVVAR